MEAAFNFYIGDRLYLWKKEKNKPSEVPIVAKPFDPSTLGLTQSKLKDLAWSLDIKDHQNPPNA